MTHCPDKRSCRAVPTRALVALLLLWTFLVAPAASSDTDDLPGQLKVAYIYNFTRFIEWPAEPANRPFVIGVIGDPEIERQLQVLETEGRQAKGRPIEIRSYPAPDAIGYSEVLFVGARAADGLDAIVRRTAGAPTLLVGDTPGFIGRGVAIEFFRKPDVFRKKERLRFRIDRDALAGRGLRVSARLLDVAEVVR